MDGEPHDTLAVAVAGGELHVARWGDGPRTVLGIHGITASSLSLVPVVRRLGAEHTLVAPDLRGRGSSAALPGPYGMRAHAEDCAAVIDAVGGGPVVVLGESMGAYVAVVLAARHPDLVERLVLADGGVPIPLPDALAGLDPDAVVELVLGPALSRLRTVFASRREYLDFWRAHPALAADWGPDLEAYLDYDLEPTSGGYRSRVREEAARTDGAEQFVDPALFRDSLASVRCPIALVRAPRNLIDEPTPLIPDDAVVDWQRRLPNLSAEMVEDVNHYTLMFGARGAAVLAARVTEAR
jgi:pimeloyl-ACP methyl ester carboxylesterase